MKGTDITQVAKDAEASGEFEFVNTSSAEWVKFESPAIRGEVTVWVHEFGAIEIEQSFNCCSEGEEWSGEFESIEQIIEKVEDIKTICSCERDEQAEF